MNRHWSALVAALALALGQVACGDPNAEEPAAETEQELTQADTATFESFDGEDGHHYFRVVASNGAKLLRSEAYTTRAAAEGGIDAVLESGPDARNYDVRTASNGQFFVSLKAENHEIIATSELYASKSSAERAARTIRSLIRMTRQVMRPVQP